MSGYPGWREATAVQLGVAAPANKYGARKTSVAGQVFDSKHEAAVYLELQAEAVAGVITDLKRQRMFPLIVKGKDGLPVLVGRYTADFVCRRAGVLEILDAKSAATKRNEAYQLRRKLFEALYGIGITER